MSIEGNQNAEIIVKQEPCEGDEQEYFEHVDSTCNGSNGQLDITALKEEVKVEPTNESCTENVYMVLPQVKDEIKKENSRENSSLPPDVCEIWLDSNQDQYYSENCKAEPENDDLNEEKGPQGDELPDEYLQEYFPDVMPHFLSEGTESDQLLQSRIVSCHKCGEVCKAGNFMEHIQLYHKYKAQPTRVRKSRRKKYVKKYLYPCPYCNKCATTFSHLKVHILTHTQEKPHKCPFCDYQGNQAIHVDSHIENKHLNIRRFKCEICDYSSNSLGCMKRHNRKHRRKTEPRQCPYCEVITFKLVTLKKHVKKYHKHEIK